MSKLNQLKNKARREEQRENWSRAIELYTQALDASRQKGEAFADLSLYNRIGDIYLRIGQKNTAVRYYEQAIERYADQDLHTSAIALCNKVLRILPERSTVYLQLGRLNLATNLVAEARQHYHRYARAMRDRGGAAAAYDALEELIERTGDARTLTLWVGWLAGESDPNVAVERVEGARDALEGQGVDPDEVIEKIRTGDISELQVAQAEVAEVDPLAGAFLSMPEPAPKTAPPAAAGDGAPGGGPADEPEPASLPLLDPIGAGGAAGGDGDIVADEYGIAAEDRAEEAAFEEDPVPADEGVETVLESMGSVTGEPELGSVPWEDEFGETSAAAIGPELEPLPAVDSDGAERSLGIEDGERPGTTGGRLESPESEDDWVGAVAASAVPSEEMEREDGEPSIEATAPSGAEGEEVEGAANGDTDASSDATERSERDASEHGAAAPGAASIAAEGGEYDGPPSIVATAMPAIDGLEVSAADPRASFSVDRPFELEVVASEGGTDVSLDPPPTSSAGLEDDREVADVPPGDDWLDGDREDSEGDDDELDASTDPAGAVAGENAETGTGAAGLEGPEGDEIEPEAVESLVSEAHAAAEAGAGADGEEDASADGHAAAGAGLPALDDVEVADSPLTPVLEDAEPDVDAEIGGVPTSAGTPDQASEPDATDAVRDPGARAAIEAETIAREVPAPAPVEAMSEEADEPSEVAEPLEPAELDDRVVEPVAGIEEPVRAEPAQAEAFDEDEAVPAPEDEVSGPIAEPRLQRMDEDPEDAFRDWVSSASMGVLRRALPELEGRSEREKALLVIRRLSLIEEPEVEFKRRLVDVLTDLGRNEEAVEACVNLALALEDLGRPIEARGAYARVLALAPQDPRALDGLERLGDVEAPEPESPEPGEVRRPYAPPHVSTRDTSMIATHPAPTNGTPSTIVPDYPVPGTRDDEHEPGGRPAPYAGVAGGVEAGSDFEQLLSEFRAELHEKPRRSDSSSRTEVGATLKEMGRLDDAIRELQAAVREPSPPPLAYELLGEAFLEKGQSRIAVRLLEKALATLGQTDREMLGVLYQLGVSYEGLNEAPKALLCYERIFSVDIDYRDVQDRILHCSSM